MNDSNGIKLKRRVEKTFNSLFRMRQDYESAWKTYRKAYAPYRGRFTRTDGKRSRSRFRRNSRPFMVGLEFAAGMKGGLTSPTVPWFNLTLFDQEAMQNEAVRIWLSEDRDIMLGTMIRTNLYEQLTDFFEEQGEFGTAAIFIDDDEQNVFRARTLTIGEYAIGEDDKKRVNKIAMYRTYTLSQLVDEFGEDNLPDTVRVELKTSDASKDEVEYEVCFYIHPNPDYVPDSLGARGMRYQSLWWVKGNSDPKHPFLKVGGFHEFPVMVARWKIIGDDLYGRGHPGEIGLDDVETIQRLETAAREALQKMASPPLLADDRLQEGGLDARADGITWFPASMGGSMPPPTVTNLFQVNFDFASCEQKIFNLKEDLNKAFYVDLFRMWSSDMRQGRTATEIQAREQEKMYVLGPIIERQMSELLDPLIARVWGIMFRRGMFPPAPPELNRMKLKVEYSSILANIQKQSSQVGIETVVGYVGNLAQLQAATGERPKVVDTIDCDEIVQQVADMYNIPSGIVFGDDKLEEIREVKDEEAQQQQMAAMAAQAAQAAPDVTGAMKDMAETPTGSSGNMLEAAIANLNGGAPA